MTTIKSESPLTPLTPLTSLSAQQALPIPQVSQTVGGGGKAKRQRKRVNTAEKRASHNAVERMRRETLNSRFLDLARLLPSLANLRRPSKSAIVNSSISYLTHTRSSRLLAARELRALSALSNELLAEVNMWRTRNGVVLKDIGGAGWTEGAEEVCQVEGEVFGEFEGGLGGGDGEDGEEEEEDAGRASFSSGGGLEERNASLVAMGYEVNGNGQILVNAHRNSSVQFGQSFPTGNISAAPTNILIPRSTGSFPSSLSDSPTSGYPSYHPESMMDQYSASTGAVFETSGYPSASLAGSQHSPLGGGSTGDLATPPPQWEQGVQAYVDSPGDGVVANSFVQVRGGGQGEVLEDWAAAMNGVHGGQAQVQRGVQQRQQGMNCLDGGFAFSGYNMPHNTSSGRGHSNSIGNNSNNGNNGNNGYNDMMVMNGNGGMGGGVFQGHGHGDGRTSTHLAGAHQSLMAHQPHMAAAVFPPAASSSPPGSGERLQSTSPTTSVYSSSPSANNLTHVQAHAQIMAAAQGLDLSPSQLSNWQKYAMTNFLSAQNQNKANAQMGMSQAVNEVLGGHVPTVGEMREVARAGLVGGGSSQSGWGIGGTSGLVV